MAPRRARGGAGRTISPPAPPGAAMGSLRSAWIDAAERALKKLHAHPFVDPEHTANRGRYLFTEPVLERFPYLRESYLKVISKPMDLRTIGERLAATRALLTGHRIPGRGATRGRLR